MIRRMLVSLAGARPDLVDKSPTDRFRYTATGGVLLTTAAVAAASAAFALIMAVRLPVAAAVVVGLLWGVVILNLDRLLLVTMTRGTGFWRSAAAAAPRVALAVLLGTVISTPLVLRVFQSEIDAELKVLAIEKTTAFEQELATNPRYAAIPDLEAQLAERQRIADSSPEAVAEADPAVVAARAAVDSTRTRYEEAQRLVQCEIDGSCGTGQPGVAAAAEERRQARDISLRNYTEAQGGLARARDAARASAGTASATARAEAERLGADLERRRADRATEQAAFDVSVGEDTGLLSRLEALDSVGERRGDLAAAQFVLFLLFLSLEVLPVLVKLMQLAGPPTVYDELVEELNAAAKRAAAKEANREEAVRDEYAEYRTQLEFDQARRQYEAGVTANELLVSQQAHIAERAIRRWSAEAAARSDRDLDAFFRDQRGGAGQPWQGSPEATTVPGLGREPR
ncbi:DUF4407 domain-containing protein [Actinokineospora sp. G85]|uniref:DUF4407 domain-containing protein n=1 Tax=Actinokineospora sp. G85 TaxID=3406626 RepID=UPI003C793150